MAKKIESEHDSDIEECKNIFVTWQWVIGIVITIVAGLAALTYAAGGKISSMESSTYNLQEDNKKINVRLDAIDRKIYNDIDTIKSILRAKQN